MLRRFSSLCVFLLAVAFVASQASANLLLSIAGAGGVNNVDLLPGQEIELTVSLTVTSLPVAPPLVAWNGGDFMLNSGSDSTFQGAVYLLDGAGAWTAVPPPGGTQRFFTGGPANTQFWFAVGNSATLGTITLRAGNTAGVYSTFFTEVLQLDSGFLPIPTATANFSYSVVPEPSSAMLLGLAASGLAFRRRRS